MTKDLGRQGAWGGTPSRPNYLEYRLSQRKAQTLVEVALGKPIFDALKTTQMTERCLALGTNPCRQKGVLRLTYLIDGADRCMVAAGRKVVCAGAPVGDLLWERGMVLQRGRAYPRSRSGCGVAAVYRFAAHVVLEWWILCCGAHRTAKRQRKTSPQGVAETSRHSPSWRQAQLAESSHLPSTSLSSCRQHHILGAVTMQMKTLQQLRKNAPQLSRPMHWGSRGRQDALAECSVGCSYRNIQRTATLRTLVCPQDDPAGSQTMTTIDELRMRYSSRCSWRGWF